MKTTISLLRGINVGGHNKIKMESLRELYRSLGFQDVRTYIQSGNIIFRSAENADSDLARMISEAIKNTFAITVTVINRTIDEFDQMISRDPFTNRDNFEARFLHVVFLDKLPERLIQVDANSRDKFVIDERNIYLFCPDGYGKTKFSNPFFEKKLGVQATTRNWRTVLKLHQLAISSF